MNTDISAARPDVERLTDQHKREHLIELVVNSVSSPHSRRAYRSGLEQFFTWWQETGGSEPFGRALVQRYRASLEARGCAPATINRQLAPLRKLAEEAALTSLLPSAVASDVQRVKGAKRLGVRTGNWLGREQAQQLLSLPDRNTLCGQRDAALLSLLLGAGLRREELAQLQIEDIQQREGRWCLIDLEGKGKRVRTVPIPAWTKEAVDTWLAAVPFQSGLVLGKVNKGGRFVGQGMTAAAIYGVVLRYEKLLQVKVKPHDLRRTFGKLAHQGGARIEQIQRSYGHATIQTTERYLGVEQDLVDAPCDHLQLQNIQSASPVSLPMTAPTGTIKDERRKTAQVRLWLPIENNSKFVRGKGKARQRIEWFCLSPYGMERGQRANEYLLQVPYRDEADLDQIIEEILGETAREADLCNCFTEPWAEDLDSGRTW